jgi:lysyl-tRNA synthetase class I
MDSVCCINCFEIINFKTEQWVPVRITCPHCDKELVLTQEYDNDLGDSLYIEYYDKNNEDHYILDNGDCDIIK